MFSRLSWPPLSFQPDFICHSAGTFDFIQEKDVNRIGISSLGFPVFNIFSSFLNPFSLFSQFFVFRLLKQSNEVGIR